MLNPFTTAVVLLAAGALADTVSTAYAKCKEVKFRVSGTAKNYVITSTTDLQAVINNASLSTTTISGTETLAGWFCDPKTQNKNSTKLQLFRGSFFTNRESWTALGGTALFSPPLSPYQPATYSWFDYANRLGYPTLAIDTLGDGASSKPDPVAVAQIPYDVAIYHDLVQQIRAGRTGQLPRAYSWIAHIGNSLGSIIGENMAAQYPADFDAIVLTGYTKLVEPSFPGVSLNNPAPAVVVNPTRFSGLAPGYVTSTSEAALTNSFFGNKTYVDFDAQVASLFFQRRDVVSLGYVVTTYLRTSFPTASKYTRRVLVLTGENDQAFCGLGSAALSPAAMCGTLLPGTATLFPAADYNWKSIPRTGHATILHKSSQNVFAVAHNFLAGASYGK